MRKGDLQRLSFWCGLWLCLAWLCPTFAHGAELTLRQLADDPPASEVLAGLHDGRLQAALARPVIRQPGVGAGWWRIDARQAVPADGAPKLVLRSPFLYRVEAWVPGADAPTRHAMYGEDADFRFSHRALVVALPEGIPADRPIWLRIEGASSATMPISVERLDDVHRQDLTFVAWRSVILAVLLVLMLLAMAFWAGTGEHSYGYFGGMLLFAIAYLVAMGGDLRWVPGAEALLGRGAQANRFFGGMGVVFSNLFQRAYLDLPKKLPTIDRLLWGGTALAGAGGGLSAFVDHPGTAALANVGLVLSALLLLVSCVVLSVRGDRAGRVVLASWAALMALITLVALEMMQVWTGPAWLGQGLAVSFAVAGLLLTIGMADKLLELRRDRDTASRRARIDAVTQLLNRHGIEERLQREIEVARDAGHPLSIAFVDLDCFKAINDAHGHGVGDECLRIVSKRLRNQLRETEVLGRYGGDEFLVLLPARASHEAAVLAERMRLAVNCRPLTMDETRVDASLSIGVAELRPGETADRLLARADAALYASKSRGRDRVTVEIPPAGPREAQTQEEP